MRSRRAVGARASRGPSQGPVNDDGLAEVADDDLAQTTAAVLVEDLIAVRGAEQRWRDRYLRGGRCEGMGRARRIVGRRRGRPWQILGSIGHHGRRYHSGGGIAMATQGGREQRKRYVEARDRALAEARRGPDQNIWSCSMAVLAGSEHELSCPDCSLFTACQSISR